MRNMKQTRPQHWGFTLIELLVVIAIIAILAAILFPVINNVRKQARQTSTLAQMHDIYIALKLFHDDNDKYPAVLVGYAQDSTGAYLAAPGNAVAIEKLTYRPMWKGGKYIQVVDGFFCLDNPEKDSLATTNAVYPVIANSSLSDQQVQFTPLIHHNMGDDKSVPEGQAAVFYSRDSYDVGPRLDAEGKAVLGGNGKPIMELHYSLDWTGGLDSTTDPHNQLKYPDASGDKTVVTWSTHQAAYAGSEKIPVLMLNGSVKPANAKLFQTKGPLGFNF